MIKECFELIFVVDCCMIFAFTVITRAQHRRMMIEAVRFDNKMHRLLFGPVQVSDVPARMFYL